MVEGRMVARAVGPAAAFVLTDEQVEALGGGKRAALLVNVGSRSARLRLARMGGENLVGLSKAARADLGIEIGDEVEVRIELDDAPRQVDVPVELVAAWADRPAVAAAFQKLSYTHQREYAEWVSSAKQQATRDRRAASAVDMLADGQTLK
jgi:hypothetical protein